MYSGMQSGPLNIMNAIIVRRTLTLLSASARTSRFLIARVSSGVNRYCERYSSGFSMKGPIRIGSLPKSQRTFSSMFVFIRLLVSREKAGPEIDPELGAADRLGLVGNQERDRVRDVARLTEPALDAFLATEFDHFRRNSAHHSRIDRAGQDRIHPDAIVLVVLRHAARERDQRELRRRVRDEVRAPL